VTVNVPLKVEKAASMELPMYLVLVMSQTILTKAIGPYLNPEYQSPKYTAHSEGDIKESFTTSGDIYLNITGNEVSLGVPV
jgi:hypothetical protein